MPPPDTQAVAPARTKRLGWGAAALLLAGFLLRWWWLQRFPYIAGDSLLYQDIAQNWLHAHVYGLSTDAAPRPTLIRLPGYPAILAACSWLFGRWLHADAGTLRSFLPVLWLQIIADLGTCWIVACTARTLYGRRAGSAALALGCLCPFLANYTAVPLTETFTLFFLALAFRMLQLWLRQPSRPCLFGISFALACGILLRPDEALLVLPVLVAVFMATRGFVRQKAVPMLLCAALTALPFIPWTVRNLHTFGVFQPLAPKLANDPGEIPVTGFQRWFRTWAVDFTATQDAYWKYPEEAVDPNDLPQRAFTGSPHSGDAVVLLTQGGDIGKRDAGVEAGFAQLAAERVHAAPLRYYVLLPFARMGDMLVHPRIEMLPIDEEWWRFSLRPKQTLFAFAYGALGLTYFVLGLLGWPAMLRRSRLLACAAVGYVVLRCALLLTLDNAEQRYTLEFLPLAILAASALWQRKNASAL